MKERRKKNLMKGRKPGRNELKKEKKGKKKKSK